MTVILDGGMGREIQARLPRAAHGIWSAICANTLTAAPANAEDESIHGIGDGRKKFFATAARRDGP